MAVCKEYFISSDAVKRITPMSGSTEDLKILPFFDFAHVVVEQILGRTLYDRVLASKVAETLTADEQTLIDDYLCPFISWHTYQRSLPVLFSIFSKNGIYTTSDDNHSSVTEGYVKTLDIQADNMTKEFQERLIDYLCENSDTAFPEYCNTSDGKEDRIFGTIKGGIVPRLDKSRSNANAANEGSRRNRGFNDKNGAYNGYY